MNALIAAGLKSSSRPQQYRDGLPTDVHDHYDQLFAHASHVQRLNSTESTSESHMAASQLMIDQADKLLAVWDGKPARGYGGTAEIVSYARDTDTPVTVVWPPGATRD